jgi:hypothetical protein
MASHCFNPFTGDITGLFEAHWFCHSYISSPVIANNKCYHALDPILKKRYITQSLRIGLYQTTIGPLWPVILNHGP